MEEFDLKLAFKQLSDVISNIDVLEQTLLKARGILRDI